MRAVAVSPVPAEPTTDTKMVSRRSARTYVEEGSEHVSKSLKSEEGSLSAEAARAGSASSRTAASEPTPALGAEKAGVDGGLPHTGLLTVDSDNASVVSESRSASIGPGTRLGKGTTLPPSDGPLNFGEVVPGVYRSSYPKAADYTFIQGLQLKTIITLVDKDFPEGYKSFITANGIKHHVFNMKGTKKESIPLTTMNSILRLVFDNKNHPVLIHCNHGKHRTGCVVGVLRKVIGWEVPNIVDEYKRYAGDKVREFDLQYITDFRLSNLSAATAFAARMSSFARFIVLATIALIIWVVSASRLTYPRRRYQAAE